MPKRNTNTNRASWFEKWFLNNKFVAVLLIILLILLIIMVFTKISHLFWPIGSFFSIIGFPLVLSGILYYLLNPLVTRLTERRVPRAVAIWISFLTVLIVVIWGVAILIPIIQRQTLGILEELPTYWLAIQQMVNEMLRYEWISSVQQQFNEISTDLLATVTARVNTILTDTVSSLGSVVGIVTNTFVGLITMPIILYYLLKEGEKLPQNLLQFVPVNIRGSFGELLKKINQQISQYVRGQIIVAFFVGLMFSLGYTIIDLQYGIVLGILAGFLNVIPYLGSFIAMVPALIIAVVDSPLMLMNVLIVFGIEQFIEGRFISPQILGNNLEIHPVTIIIVLLTAGELFGIIGFILGIPGYAVLKVIFMHIFDWYKEISGLYNETDGENLI